MDDLVVRLMTLAEVPMMVDYFLTADAQLIDRMGVDPAKLPGRQQWIDLVGDDFNRPLPERHYLFMVAELDGEPVGHCNANKIVFGREAYMHLHVWEAGHRRRGVGSAMVSRSVVHFCEHLQLEWIFCEPKADNEAPNRTLARTGFELLDTYRTTPGWLNYEQDVNRWRLRCRP